MKRFLPNLWVAAAAIAVTHLAWVAFLRTAGDNKIQRPVRQERAGSHPDFLGTGSGGVKILQFYANAGEITRGEHAVVCYGVANAASVRLEPDVEQLAPAWNRCFSVEPEATTTYTLTAADPGGRQVSASFTVEVKEPPPAILFVAISDKEVKRGQSITTCYGVKNATRARLEPIFPSVPPIAKSCLRFYPAVTMKYTLVAASEDGRTDRERFVITVR